MAVTSPHVRVTLPGAAVACALVAAVLLAFHPALAAGWMDIWDDDLNFLANPDFRPLGPEAIGWAFTTTHGGPYQPLSWLSLSFDRTLWGLEPAGYHVTNLLLHAAATCAAYGLFVDLLRRAPWSRARPAGRLQLPAALGALVFGVHPLRVESVVWITERRDVLAGLFFLLCVRAYLRWKDPGPGTESSRRAGMWCFGLFTLSLLAKASAMTLPVALLAVDAWPLGRFRDPRSRRSAVRTAVLEKLPFLAVAACIAVVAWAGQTGAGPRVERDALAPFAQAAYGLVFYAGSTVLPVRLSPLYELLAFDPTGARAVLAVVLVVAAGGALWMTRRRVPALVTAALVYACVAAPTLGLTQFGSQLVADRYSYFACVPFAAIAAGVAARSGHARAALVVVVVLLGTLTHGQARHWRDSTSLWSHAVAVDPHNSQARFMLATAELREDRLPEAETHLRRAVELAPREPAAWSNLGLVRARRGDLREAFRCWEEALRVRPGYGPALRNIEDARRGAFGGEGR